MLKLNQKRQYGFTIVELLIVIVVIGILAALVLNAFSNAQLQARNAQTISAIEAYKKGLVAYATVNGNYPQDDWVCLGQGYPGGICWGNSAVESQVFSDKLRTVMGKTLPLASVAGGTSGPLYTSNAAGANVTLDGTPVAMIYYMLEGSNSKCQVGPIVSAAHWPYTLSSDPVGNASAVGSNVVQCFIPLPQP